jgi:hypothetical protein
MGLRDYWKKVAESRAGRLAGQAHDHADRVYQTLAAPTQPLQAETHKKPWRAALLSLVIVGAGQLYNRQLGKALTLCFFTYVGGVAAAILYIVLWLAAPDWEHRSKLGYALLAVWGALWLFAGVDAYRTAAALRDGRLFVRYGLRRQGVHAALGFLPFADALLPAETVSAEEVHRPVGDLLKEEAKGRLLRWVVVRLLRYTLLAVGAVLLLTGYVLDQQPLLIAGGVAAVAGFLLFRA